MEPRDANAGDRPQPPGPDPAGPQVVETGDPAVMSGPADSPDRTTVVETGDVRGADASNHPQLLVVPVPSPTPAGQGTPSRDRDEAGGKDRDQDKGKPAHPAHSPSLLKLLLFAGLVALVCGVAGAWGYNYFFGSSKSDDAKSSGGKGSDSGKGSKPGANSEPGKPSDSPGQAASKAEVQQAQAAWMSAVKELHQAQAAEKAARRSEEETKAVLDFFKRTLLSPGRTGDSSLAEAFWAGGQRKDVTLRKALDQTDPQVAGAFADRPLAEAKVREMLGLAYLNVGEASKAVDEYERALALREAVQGSNTPDTADCRNQLAVAYRLAGRTDEAGRLFESRPNSPAQASALAVHGTMLLLQNKPAEAELKFREALTIREKTQPDDWATFDTKSCLGQALLEQDKFADAEPLLLSGYRGLKQREGAMPDQDKPRVTKALERLVKLYDAWGKPDDAKKWRKELGAAG